MLKLYKLIPKKKRKEIDLDNLFNLYNTITNKKDIDKNIWFAGFYINTLFGHIYSIEVMPL